MVLQISPQKKIRGFKSSEWGAHSKSHFLPLSLSWNRSLSQLRVWFNVWGSPHLAETTGYLDQSLCDVRVMPRISPALPHNVPYSSFEPSHFRLQTNTDRLCHVWKWLPMLCALLSVTVSVRLPPGVLYPSKHYFFYWHVVTAESALRQRTKHDPKSLDCLRLCHKTIYTLQHVLPCQPPWAFVLFGSSKDTNEDLIWEHASKSLERSPDLDYAVEAISLDSVRLTSILHWCFFLS